MKYLAIDTANDNLTVIVKGKKLVKEFDPKCKTNHSVNLMPTVEKCLNDGGVGLNELDFIACVVGAGSFTGIRIGVATVKALAYANGKKVLPITSFDTIAYTTLGEKILAVIDAGHNGYYVCGYDGSKVVLPPEYVDGNRLSLLSREFTLLSNIENQTLGIKGVNVSDGLLNAIENKLDEVTDDIESLEPVYIRKSQAEENR